MLIGIALVLLLAWLLGLLGLYDVGELVHVFLLFGLVFLFAAVKRAIDAASGEGAGSPRP
jgi:hypothetical protein